MIEVCRRHSSYVQRHRVWDGNHTQALSSENEFLWYSPTTRMISYEYLECVWTEDGTTKMRGFEWSLYSAIIMCSASYRLRSWRTHETKMPTEYTFSEQVVDHAWYCTKIMSVTTNFRYRVFIANKGFCFIPFREMCFLLQNAPKCFWQNNETEFGKCSSNLRERLCPPMENFMWTPVVIYRAEIISIDPLRLW